MVSDATANPAKYSAFFFRLFVVMLLLGMLVLAVGGLVAAVRSADEPPDSGGTQGGGWRTQGWRVTSLKD